MADTPPPTPPPATPEPAPAPAPAPEPQPTRGQRFRSLLHTHRACIITSLLVCAAYQLGGYALAHCPPPHWPEWRKAEKSEEEAPRRRTRVRVVYRCCCHD